jgi:hypothetical protein
MAGCFGFFIFTRCGEWPARYGRSLGLETNPSNPKQAGVPEEVGTDLALLEVGQEDAIDAPRKQPGQVRLAHAQRQLANVVAVGNQDIEGVELHFIIMLATV